MSKLYFFRHAQASFLAEDYDQLSPLGIQQSTTLGEYLVKKDFHFDKIFIGPLLRQKKTFETVASIYAQHHLKLPTPIILPELKEHSGPEGMRMILPKLIEADDKVKNWHQQIKENPQLRKRNSLLIFQYFMERWSAGKIEVKGIEPWKTFRKEVKKGLTQILESTSKGETIGTFTSGGTIAAITAEALEITNEKRVAALNFAIRNTAINSFLFSRDHFNLLSFNELPHLEANQITFV